LKLVLIKKKLLKDGFKEDELELECAAFKVLKSMLQKGLITPEEIEDAFS
jgi:hypothetical protein